MLEDIRFAVLLEFPGSPVPMIPVQVGEDRRLVDLCGGGGGGGGSALPLFLLPSFFPFILSPFLMFIVYRETDFPLF